MRAFAVANPAVPMAIVVDFDDLRLNLGLFVFFRTLRLLRVGLQIGPHPRHGGYVLAVRKPANAIDAVGKRGHAARFTAIGGDDVELCFGVGVFAFAASRAGELFASFAVGGIEPELRRALVGFHRVGRLIDHDPFAVWRNAGRADALALPEVFDGEVFVRGFRHDVLSS